MISHILEQQLTLNVTFLKFCLVLFSRKEFLTKPLYFAPGLERCNKKWVKKAPGESPRGRPKGGLPGQLFFYWVYLLDILID